MDGNKLKGSSVSKNANLLRKGFSSFLSGISFTDLKRHGNSSWSIELLVRQAILWRMSSESNVTDAHDDAKENCQQLFGGYAAASYQALMNILTVYGAALMNLLMQKFREQVVADPASRIAGYFALAVDGSKPSAPRTRSNEQRFVSRKYGQGKNAKYRKATPGKGRKRKSKEAKENKVTQPVPNVLLTKFWNIALQTPWHWSIGGAETDERGECMKAIKTLKFPKDTLIVADAGFIGYQLWRSFAATKLTFLVRAGSNVHLKTKDAAKGLYYYYPSSCKKGDPPIVVRMVKIKIGKTKMAMLTNELDPNRMPKELIRELYELRWGVEVDFRDFKQTFDCKKFRCKSAKRVIVEANWSMLAFTLIKWWTHKHLARYRKDSRKASFTLALKAFRRALNTHNNIETPSRTLHDELCAAVIDNYQRRSSKTARYKPVGEKPSTGLPIIHSITPEQKRKLEAALQNAA